MENHSGLIKKVANYFESIIGVKKKIHLGEITELLIKRYALSIGDDNPLYYNQEYARKHGFPDIIAPPNMLVSIVEWGPGSKESNLHKDGTPTEGSILPPEFKGVRVMGGGEQMTLFKDVVVGTKVELESEVVDSFLKEGRKGPIALVVTNNKFYDEAGALLVMSKRTMIAR